MNIHLIAAHLLLSVVGLLYCLPAAAAAEQEAAHWLCWLWTKG
ncbi:MAG: hypothetical protein VB877_03855 [Pirellulaceae bacterium]